jgi:hypothetical protein
MTLASLHLKRRINAQSLPHPEPAGNPQDSIRAETAVASNGRSSAVAFPATVQSMMADSVNTFRRLIARVIASSRNADFAEGIELAELYIAIKEEGVGTHRMTPLWSRAGHSVG